VLLSCDSVYVCSGLAVHNHAILCPRCAPVKPQSSPWVRYWRLVLQAPLTDMLLRSVKRPAAGRTEISDLGCSGLVFRMTASGAASWSFRFRDKRGSQTRATIGAYPAVSLKAARTQANALRAVIAAGGNPNHERRAARSGSDTFGALADRYLAEHSRRRKRSYKTDERNLRLHVLPRWRDRAYAGESGIKRSDVIELIERLVTAGKPTQANRVQALISSIFTFGMDADLVEANPCSRLKRRGVENIGRRVLSDDEIRLFWHGIVVPERRRRIGLGLQLGLLTGARPGEIAGICRSELDRLSEPTRAVWIIPAARTKNGRPHLIPIVPMARDVILAMLATIEPGEEYLVPTITRSRRGPVQGTALAQTMAEFGRQLEGDAVAVRTWKAEPPTPHDLRRTVGTRLAELRIPKEIRDRVLNHAARDVGSKHYNLHDYAEEKREALTRLAAVVRSLITGNSAAVAPLRLAGMSSRT
jgi:integrase